MIVDAITNLCTWRFAFGVLVGAVGQRAATWCWHRWQDRRNPLPGGRRRRMPALSRVWVAGAAVVAVLAYQIVQAQRLATCQQQFADALVDRASISVENDRLSLAQRELLAENQRAEAHWISELLHPSDPAVAALPLDDPRRQEWGLAVSNQFFSLAASLADKIAAISAEQLTNDRQRAAARIPDPTCGRGGYDRG